MKKTTILDMNCLVRVNYDTCCSNNTFVKVYMSDDHELMLAVSYDDNTRETVLWVAPIVRIRGRSYVSTDIVRKITTGYRPSVTNSFVSDWYGSRTLASMRCVIGDNNVRSYTIAVDGRCIKVLRAQRRAFAESIMIADKKYVVDRRVIEKCGGEPYAREYCGDRPGIKLSSIEQFSKELCRAIDNGRV